MKRLITLCLAAALIITSATLTGCTKQKAVKTDKPGKSAAAQAADDEADDGADDKMSDNNSDEVKTPDKNEDTAVKKSVDKSVDKSEVVEFKNKHLAASLCKVFGKDSLTFEDCEKVKYLAIGPETETTSSIFVGFDDYADAYFAEIQKQTPSPDNLRKYVKVQPLECSDDDDYNDLGLFTNVQVFEYYNISIKDVSFIKNYSDLYFGYFNSNGITDVTSLSDFAPANLRELDFTGNSISDWKPLEHIKDKVIVLYTVEEKKNDDGTTSSVPKSIYLKDFLTNYTPADGKDAESKEIQKQLEESAKDIDWSALFDDEDDSGKEEK